VQTSQNFCCGLSWHFRPETLKHQTLKLETELRVSLLEGLTGKELHLALCFAGPLPESWSNLTALAALKLFSNNLTGG
jgi:hypothetical protein